MLRMAKLAMPFTAGITSSLVLSDWHACQISGAEAAFEESFEHRRGIGKGMLTLTAVAVRHEETTPKREVYTLALYTDTTGLATGLQDFQGQDKVCASDLATVFGDCTVPKALVLRVVREVSPQQVSQDLQRFALSARQQCGMTFNDEDLMALRHAVEAASHGRSFVKGTEVIVAAEGGGLPFTFAAKHPLCPVMPRSQVIERPQLAKALFSGLILWAEDSSQKHLLHALTALHSEATRQALISPQR